MIESLAYFYVNVLEPAFYILLILLAVLCVLYIINMLRGGGGKGDFLSTVVNGMVKILVKTVQIIGSALVGSLKMLLKTISLIFATVRDFLKSEI